MRCAYSRGKRTDAASAISSGGPPAATIMAGGRGQAATNCQDPRHSHAARKSAWNRGLIFIFLSAAPAWFSPIFLHLLGGELPFTAADLLPMAGLSRISNLVPAILFYAGIRPVGAQAASVAADSEIPVTFVATAIASAEKQGEHGFTRGSVRLSMAAALMGGYARAVHIDRIACDLTVT